MQHFKITHFGQIQFYLIEKKSLQFALILVFIFHVGYFSMCGNRGSRVKEACSK